MIINEEALILISKLLDQVPPLDLAETLRIIKPVDNWVLKATVTSLFPENELLRSLSPEDFRICLMEIFRDHDSQYKLELLLKKHI